MRDTTKDILEQYCDLQEEIKDLRKRIGTIRSFSSNILISPDRLYNVGALYFLIGYFALIRNEIFIFLGGKGCIPKSERGYCPTFFLAYHVVKLY